MIANEELDFPTWSSTRAPLAKLESSVETCEIDLESNFEHGVLCSW